MNILVPIKRVIDYRVKIRVKSDKTGVETKHVKMSMNPFDEIAVEEAIKLKEQGIANQIIIVSIGATKSQDIIRQALAMGADRGILINTDETEYSVNLAPLNIAKILKNLILKENIDLAILGKQAIDSDNNQVGQMLAAMLDWPQGTFISSLNIIDKKIQVTREVDGGAQTIELNLPALVTTDLRLNQPRYPSMPNIMKAKRKPFEIINIQDFIKNNNITINNNLETLEVNSPKLRESGIKVANVNELINKLHIDKKII
tara:strand:+ start:13030 stop:13806 length:777 start_codon:yes stop_codon:yes gene_type:complete